jgi:PAS domain S-box-containing protein
MMNEQYFFTLLDIYPAAIIIHDLQNVIFANNAAVTLFKSKDKNEVFGKPILNFVHPSSLNVIVESLGITNEETFELKNILLTPLDGSVIVVDILGSYVTLNELEYVQIVINDITQLKIDEKRYRSLYQLSPEGIVLQDENGIILDANIALCEMMGFNHEELIGNSIKIVAPHANDEVIKENIKKILSGGSLRHESFGTTKNGAVLNVNLTESAIPLTRGSLGVLTIISDITERKKNEAILIQAKEKAEEMNRLKSNFLLNMSHELRTPMIGILGFSEILTEYENDPEVQQTSDRIFKSANRLMESLNLILDLTKVEAGKIDYVPTEFDGISTIKNICSQYEFELERKDLCLKLFSNLDYIYFSSDKKLFSAIINNIINNAIKFTKIGGVIINLRLETEGLKSWFVVSVKDSGIGIAEKDQKLIFDEFRQVSEGIGRNFEGTGLGLTLAKNYIEKFEGTLTVNSSLNSGSTFTIKFPFNIMQDSKEHKFLPDVNVLYNFNCIIENQLPKILYVENDPISFDVVKRLLKDICQVEQADEGEEALNKISTENYALILMDINLGRGLDGLELTRIIREMENHKDIPIIAVTAYAMYGDRMDAISAGCNHYISKPFSKKDFRILVSKTLEPADS